MATVIWAESGTDATQDFSFYDVTQGSVTSDTSQAKTGPRSVNVSTSSPAVTALVNRSGVLNDAGRRISVWFRFDTLPAVTDNFIALRDVSGNIVHRTGLTTTGSVDNVPVGATTVNGTIVLAVNTWYLVTVCYVITNSTTFQFDIYVDGVLDSSATAGTLTNTATDQLRLQRQSAAGANLNAWFDNIVIDNGTPANGFPGDLRVTAKRPNANGTANNFVTQIGSGGSGYGSGHSPQVNEQALSTTNGWSIAAVAATTEEYNIENRATGDVNLTGAVVVGLVGWVYAKALVAETAQLIVDNATTNISLTSTISHFYAAATQTSYPAGTGTDVGMITSTTVTTVSLYECGVVIVYTEPPPSLTLTGVQ